MWEDAIALTRKEWPHASAAFERLMERAPFASIDEGLVAESLVYSELQAGEEFAAWRAATPRKQRPRQDSAVYVERSDDELRIVLNRSETRNALNVQMRDEWLDALAVAHADPSLRVVVSGNGPSFCADDPTCAAGKRPWQAVALEGQQAGATLHMIDFRTGQLFDWFVSGSTAFALIEQPEPPKQAE